MNTTKENAAIAAQEVSTSQGEIMEAQSSLQAEQVNAGATNLVAEDNNNINSNNSSVMENSVAVVNGNTVANSANSQINIENLRKELEKEQSTLTSMSKKGVAPAVLQAQQQVVDELKTKLESFPEIKAAEVEIKADVVTFEVVDDETGAKENVQMKMGFVDNNRAIDNKKVAVFIAIIANSKYEKAYPVIVIKAKLLISVGYSVKDITGKVITKEEAEDYLVILDGQHRSKAFAQLIAAGQDFVIPNVRVRELADVGEYLTVINEVGNWTKNDKVTVSALINRQDKLLQAIAARLKEGFNFSTLCQIYTGKKLSDKALNNALKGKTYNLPKDAKVDIDRGDRFITLCQAAEMKTAFITKRYFIEGFNHHCKSVGEENAFKALENLKNLKDKEAKFKAIKDDGDFIELLADLKQ